MWMNPPKCTMLHQLLCSLHLQFTFIMQLIAPLLLSNFVPKGSEKGGLAQCLIKQPQVLLIYVLQNFVSKTDDYFLKAAYSPAPRIMFTVLLSCYTAYRKKIYYYYYYFWWKGLAYWPGNTKTSRFQSLLKPSTLCLELSIKVIFSPTDLAILL